MIAAKLTPKAKNACLLLDMASRRRLASLGTLLSTVASHASACICPSWDMGSPGLRWSGGDSPGPIPAESAEECQEFCCNQNRGDGSCVAFTFTATPPLPDMACTLWSTTPQSQSTEPGWTSGTLSAPADCSALAGQVGWLVVAFLGGGGAAYCVIGMAFKKVWNKNDLQMQGSGEPDWLPHHQFWAALYGLIVDGVMCCASCGHTAGGAPEGFQGAESLGNPDLTASFLTSEDEMRRNSWSVAGTGSPTPSPLRASTGVLGSPAGSDHDGGTSPRL